MQSTSVGDPGGDAGADDFPIVITTMPAKARHYKIAFGGFIVLVVVVAPTPRSRPECPSTLYITMVGFSAGDLPNSN